MANLVTIRSLHIYPVKGCAAVDVGSIGFDADGLIDGDRRVMIVDAATGAFISQRHEPRLATLRATWRDGLPVIGRLHLEGDDGGTEVDVGAGGASRRVTVWDDTFDATDLGEYVAAFLSDFLGREVRLVALSERSPRMIDPYWAGEGTRTSFADLAPILVTSTASLDDLNARRATAGRAPIAMARFRPNVVIDGLPAWGEDRVAWLRLRRGMSSAIAAGARLELIKPCARCAVIELDPSNGESSGDEVLRSLADFRAGRNRRGTPGVFFGMNATFRSPNGAGIAVGDRLNVKQYSDK